MAKQRINELVDNLITAYNQGSKFDAAGNLANWWTAEDRASFHARASWLVEQYNTCIPVAALHINGELTLGENIADLGGLCIALDACNLPLAIPQQPVFRHSRDGCDS